VAPCKVDVTTSKTFSRQLRSLEKKYRKIRTDLEDAVSAIEADHEHNGFNPVAVRKFGRRVWEYSFGSTDMRKHPRESFRMICAFTEPPTQTLYAIICFWKGDQQYATEDEISDGIELLIGQLRAPDDESS